MAMFEQMSKKKKPKPKPRRKKVKKKKKVVLEEPKFEEVKEEASLTTSLTRITQENPKQPEPEKRRKTMNPSNTRPDIIPSKEGIKRKTSDAFKKKMAKFE